MSSTDIDVETSPLAEALPVLFAAQEELRQVEAAERQLGVRHGELKDQIRETQAAIAREEQRLRLSRDPAAIAQAEARLERLRAAVPSLEAERQQCARARAGLRLADYQEAHRGTQEQARAQLRAMRQHQRAAGDAEATAYERYQAQQQADQAYRALVRFVGEDEAAQLRAQPQWRPAWAKGG